MRRLRPRRPLGAGAAHVDGRRARWSSPTGLDPPAGLTLICLCCFAVSNSVSCSRLSVRAADQNDGFANLNVSRAHAVRRILFPGNGKGDRGDCAVGSDGAKWEAAKQGNAWGVRVPGRAGCFGIGQNTRHFPPGAPMAPCDRPCPTRRRPMRQRKGGQADSVAPRAFPFLGTRTRGDP